MEEWLAPRFLHTKKAKKRLSVSAGGGDTDAAAISSGKFRTDGACHGDAHGVTALPQGGERH
jgi:hypothetical protein